MKLIQLNSWRGKLGTSILDLIQSEQPDFVCLQETVSLPSGAAGGFFLPVEELAAKTQLNLIHAPTFGFNFADHPAQFGVAILSKNQALSSNIFFTEGQYQDNQNFVNDPYNIGNVLHLTFEIGDQPLHILTHHGFWLAEHKNGSQTTTQKCQMIEDYIARLKSRIILTGDLNLAPDSPSLQGLNQLLRNLTLEHQLQTTRTFLTHKTEPVDYIFVNGQVEVQNFRASDIVVSDHQALVMEFGN
jgi:endonuclease/exonuclease/phosphatase (EEP) superfamily protein YafD